MPNRINGQKFPDRLKTKKVIGTASPSGLTISSTSFTYLTSVRVDNIFTASDILTVTAMTTKSATNGTCSLQLYWNNTNDLTTPTSLGFYRSNDVNGKTFLFQRRIAISNVTGSGNGSMILKPTVNALNDLMPSINGHGATGGGVEYTSIDWTTTGYIILAGQNSSSSDYLQTVSLQISN